ncbi:hypothetical protein B9G98_04662 [Wickerhamiella sorbophila]|uniref:Uncharacterized protein n=1 Tax=Wickerhamiella sorbophila TaxID=45607 RepID=A0A2T0FPW9_9ASCO|nr:hypothetical protein B9G98_04662 [Wickerhamiella sorbophila]PRT57042.1 hypothetical protein B9G98_04662 [Wickerhamiella sorbophila]
MVKSDVHIDCHYVHYTCNGEGCETRQFPVGELQKHLKEYHNHRRITLSISDNPIPEDIVEQLGAGLQALALIPTPTGTSPLLEFEYYLGSRYIHCRSPECRANSRLFLVDLGNHVREKHPYPAVNCTVRTRNGFLLSSALKQDIIDLGNRFTGGMTYAGGSSGAAPVVKPVQAASDNTLPPIMQVTRRSGSLSFLLNPDDDIKPGLPPSPPTVSPSSVSDEELETASILLEFAQK